MKKIRQKKLSKVNKSLANDTGAQGLSYSKSLSLPSYFFDSQLIELGGTGEDSHVLEEEANAFWAHIQ